MKTCDTCQHWQNNGTCYGLVPIPGPGGSGYELRPRRDDEPIGMATFIKGLLHPGPKFGCTHHKPV